MRMLQYKLSLTSMGYLVVSSEIQHQEAICPEECLPIRLTNLEHSDDYLVGCISDIITENPKFRRKHKQVLLGKYPGCYLYSFEVQPTHIVLSYTYGTIILEPGVSSVKLQFDVPHKNGKSDSKYTIFLYRSSDLKTGQEKHSARVHEYVGDVHRELYFEQFGERDYSTDADRYVYVDEYVDP